MPVLMIVEVPGGTPELYEALNDDLDIHSSDDLPEGCIAHTAGLTDEGLMVVDVWESAEAFGRFAEERLGPAAAKRSMPELQPRMMPVHNRIHAGQGTQAGVIGIFETPMTAAQYDEMTAKMPAHTDDGSGHPAVSHTAGIQDGTIIVVDIWESPEAFRRFSGQISSALGGEPPPMQSKFVPIHAHMQAPAPAGAS
jgi:heme-degrading monooxygenase HmoA